MFSLRIVLALCLTVAVQGFYDSKGDVVELTPANFANVEKSKALWLVEFFAPWCGHCKNLTPVWKEAATALKGIIRVGAVDADAHKDLGSKFGVQSFPTIKVFGGNKKAPTDYQGARTTRDFINEAFKIVEKEALSKLK